MQIQNIIKLGYKGTLLFKSAYLRKCEEFVTRFETFNDPHDLENQLETVLNSNASGASSSCATN